MNFQSVSSVGLKWGLCACAILIVFAVRAQDDGETRIKILQADAILRDQRQPDVQRLIGAVLLGYGDATLACDSALRFKDGRFRTMGNVRLNDGNRRVLAENMLLNPQADKAIATATSGEQVRMQSELGEIQATRVDYELDTKWVRFPSGGTMQEQSRTATFDRGLFKVDDSMLELGGNVFIDDGDWVVTSDSLHWDEKNEKLFFHGFSHVLEQSGGLELSCFFGAFDAAQEAGWFASEEAGSGSKARVRQDDVWLEADRLEVPTDSLEPLSAIGRVEIQDTARVWKVWGSDALRRQGATGEKLVSVRGGGSEMARYMDASSADTLWLISDSMEIQSNWTRLWPGVHLIQGQAAASCEELFWNDSTEQIDLLGTPLTWLEGWLLKADSMTWQLKGNQPEKLSARGHSGLIFDIDSMCMQQISGRNLDAYFTDGALNSVEVAGNAESIYFDTEKPNPCEAFNQSVSSAMRIDFDAGDIKDIVLLQKPEGVWSTVQGEVPELKGMAWQALPKAIREAFEKDRLDFSSEN